VDAEQSAQLTGTNRPCGLTISLRQTSSVACGIRIARIPTFGVIVPDERGRARRSGQSDPKVSGGDLEEATPDPIPNSEVKLLGADGTAREAVWESRTLPGFIQRACESRLFFFALCPAAYGRPGFGFCSAALSIRPGLCSAAVIDRPGLCSAAAIDRPGLLLGGVIVARVLVFCLAALWSSRSFAAARTSYPQGFACRGPRVRLRIVDVGASGPAELDHIRGVWRRGADHHLVIRATRPRRHRA
jgi:hypothetical protein